MGGDALVSRIECLVAQRVPGSRPAVQELRQLSGGLSRGTWRLQLRMAGEAGIGQTWIWSSNSPRVRTP